MRFVLIDRILRIEEGKRIVGVTTFAAAVDAFADHFKRRATVPATLIVEAMVQTLGWAIIHAHAFRLMPILSLFEGVRLATPQVLPGSCADVTAEIISTSETDSLGRAWLEIGGERVASVERVIYTHVRAKDPAHLRRTFATLSAPPSDPKLAEEEPR